MERKSTASSALLMVVLALASAGQPGDLAGQLAHGWLGPCHGTDPYSLERIFSFVWTLMGHGEGKLRCCQSGWDNRSHNRGNKATLEEAQASMGIENKSIRLQAILIVLLLEQLVKFHDTDCFSSYFSFGGYMKQIPNELSHLTMG